MLLPGSGSLLQYFTLIADSTTLAEGGNEKGNMSLNENISEQDEISATEISPLLPHTKAAGGTLRDHAATFTGEIWLLIRSSCPVILAYGLQNSLQTASVVIVGRLSPEVLATSAFSYMFAMSTAWLIALGGTTAIDTLASSAFTGSTDKTVLGVILQRGLLVLSGLYALVAILWWFSRPLFQLLLQADFICEQSPIFLRCLIPGGLGYIWFEAMKKYLQCQGMVHPPQSKAKCLVLKQEQIRDIFRRYICSYHHGAIEYRP